MRYERPGTLERALNLLEEEGQRASLLAGGTDLIVQMQTGLRQPDLIIDIKAIPELMQITERDGGFEIGAGVSAARIAEHSRLAEAWPGVVEAVALIGSTQVQSRATPVGNLCNGSPAADAVPALIAAAAMVSIMSKAGPRQVAVEEIPAGPGKTSLAPGEIIASLFLPSRPAQAADAYLRMTPRSEMDIAVVGAAVSLTFATNGTCSDARVAIGAVAPTARLVEGAGAALVGTIIDNAAVQAAMSAARDASIPIDDKRGSIDYRVATAGVLVGRAIRIARERATTRRNGV